MLTSTHSKCARISVIIQTPGSVGFVLVQSVIGLFGGACMPHPMSVCNSCAQLGGRKMNFEFPPLFGLDLVPAMGLH